MTEDDNGHAKNRPGESLSLAAYRARDRNGSLRTARAAPAEHAKPSKWRRWVGGAVLLLAVALHRCRAPRQVVRRRQSQCRGDGTSVCGKLGRVCGIDICRACGCTVWGKTRLALASCPDRKWRPVPAKRCGIVCVLRCLGLSEGRVGGCGCGG